jgi:hypothetical protein
MSDHLMLLAFPLQDSMAAMARVQATMREVEGLVLRGTFLLIGLTWVECCIWFGILMMDTLALYSLKSPTF